MVRWVKADEGARANDLDRLLPLVRFQQMESIAPLMAEPLFMGHPLGMQLMVECHASFATSAAAADCPRLRPRKGVRQVDTEPDLDWMDTTDGFEGFKKLHHFPNMVLAVSKTGKMESAKVYEAPAGWHWGSQSEVAAIMGGGKRAQQPEMYYYTDHGGWEGTGWNGVHRLYFVFSDTLVVGGHLNPRFGEGYIQELAEADLAKRLPTAFFAGIVCVRDWAGPAVCSRSRNAATIVTHGTKSRSLDN